MMIDERTVLRVAGELLISQEERWEVREARAVTVRALAAIGVVLPDRAFHFLVQAAYRVGGVVEQVAGLDNVCPWEVEEIQRTVDTAVLSWLDPEPRKPFVDAISAHIKNKEPFRPRILDWTPEINRFLRHTGTQDFFPDLMSKLSVASRIDAIVEERRDRLISHAANALDIRLDSVAAVMQEEIQSARARACVRKERELAASRRRVVLDEQSREDEDRLCVTLTALVHERKRALFSEWLQSLSPRARHAVCHRIALLVAEPLVHRLWVKSIVGSTRMNLRELRVIAEDIHYRILFVGNPSERPLIVAFGLRRDLEDLITVANRYDS
jgi:hypothetical protein